MARSKIRSQGVQLDTDTGAVLFSLIQGEQLDYEITLNWLTDIGGYEFEAVVMEGDNTGNGKIPKVVRPAGVNTTLVIDTPTDRGTWSALTSYSIDDIVIYNGLTYRNIADTLIASSITPDLRTTAWERYINNKIRIQFPTTTASTWTTQPLPDKAVYGFFDLRVTEPISSFRKTYKPMQGMVEVSFSPTYLVA